MGRTRFSTPLGVCEVSWNDAALTRFRLPPAEGGGTSSGDPPPEWVARIMERVRRHLGGELQDFTDVAVEWSQVSDFQRAVYERSRRVAAGRTCSYGDIAADLGLGPAGARAVGVALGSNPWPLIVPCHRVIATDGRMTGFSAPGGVRAKTRLLAIEGAELLSE